MTTEALAPIRPSLGARLMAGHTVPVLLVILALLAIWYVMVPVMNWGVASIGLPEGQPLSTEAFIARTMELERPVLPAPHQILVELKKTVIDTAITSKRSLVYHAFVTISSTVVGFLMGTLLGIVLAILIVHVRSLEKSLMPWVIASQTVPILAVAPIIIVVLGSQGITGLVPKSIISAYLCFFPVTIGMVKGLTSPDRLQLDLMRTYNASRGQTFLKLRWPASVPFLFASLKVAIAISLVGAIVGELPTGAQAGIGARLLAGSYYGQTIQIWAALIGAAVLAGALVALIGVIEGLTRRLMGGRT